MHKTNIIVHMGVLVARKERDMKKKWNMKSIVTERERKGERGGEREKEKEKDSILATFLVRQGLELVEWIHIDTMDPLEIEDMRTDSSIIRYVFFTVSSFRI